MPSATDIFNQLVAANGHLTDIATKLDAVKASTDAVQAAEEQVASILATNFSQLIALTSYTNQALYHNDQQNDTIICILEKIAKNTCDLVNQSYLQTALQTIIQKNTTGLAGMYASAHAEAALALERERALRQEIEKCCPPKPPTPPCQEQPCATTKLIGPPPDLKNKLQ
jgi:hypothetical protein